MSLPQVSVDKKKGSDNRPNNQTPKAVTQSTPSPAEYPVIPPKFTILVHILQWCISRGVFRPVRTGIAVELSKHKNIYRDVGITGPTKFRQYMALAEKEGIVVLGGLEPDGWVGLLPKWKHAVPANTS